MTTSQYTAFQIPLYIIEDFFQCYIFYSYVILLICFLHEFFPLSDYYQWVPFVLGLQCIMFYLPRIFWQMVTYYRYGTDLQKLVAMSMEAITSQIKDTRDDLVRYVARTLEQMLFHYRDNRTSFCARLNRMGCVCTLSKRLGYWLVLSYVLMKLMYLANAIGQIYLMQRFLGLGTNYSYFGINIVHDIMSGRDWQKTMVFPRVTFCHVSLKSVGSNNHVVAQCVLPVNMLNEKIYVFLWFWVVLACILTAVSIPLWVLRLMRLKSNADFVRKYLELAEIFAKEDRPLVNKFVRHFLRQDGIFMLRMLSLNAGDLVTSEIVIELWNSFREKYKHRDFRNDGREGFSLRTIQPSAPEEECLKAT